MCIWPASISLVFSKSLEFLVHVLYSCGSRGADHPPCSARSGDNWPVGSAVSLTTVTASEEDAV